MTSRRERLRNLFASAHIHRPGHGQHSSHAPHPPRASETRGFTTSGLFVRSPNLRGTPEQDVLQDELPDDIEFLSLDNPQYDEPETFEQDDLDTIDEDGDYRGGVGSGSSSGGGSGGGGSNMGDSGSSESEDDMKDWPDDAALPVDGSDKAVHLEGVPRSDIRLAARQYKQAQFAKDLLHLLQYELKVPGWVSLPAETTHEQLSIYKVSGSLTNAVFFISFPSPSAAATDYMSSSMSTVTRGGEGSGDTSQDQPPTILLRIYGPSSGNLISRKKELHVLNTLSACYGIGPAILGTFTNGRLEEYFESRALYKEEMRQPRISRWIARRMRELHSVDLNLMELPSDHPKSPFFGPTSTMSRKSSSDMTRPSLANNDSGISTLSTSYASSVRSFSSSYSELSTSVPPSPALNARSSSRPGVYEGPAPRKKRSQSSLGSRADFSLEGEKYNKPTSVVWQNIDSWTREAKKILKKVDKLETMIEEMRERRRGDGIKEEFIYDVNPLNAPSLLAECRKLLDLQALQQEMKKYRKYIQKREAQYGRSKRVFAHNDAQCGNLLILTPGGKDEIAPNLRFPHEMIIVVDFEYAGVNPRGFDIGNHFLEWQTDYHHPTLSHSLTRHSRGPTLEERQRFYRAYIPCDGAFDTGVEPTIPPLAEDDPRVQRLEEEVQLWTPASHAMYTVWSIVQATDDIVRTIDGWLEDRQVAEEAESRVQAYRKQLLANGGEAENDDTARKHERTKSGDDVWITKPTPEEVERLENGTLNEEEEKKKVSEKIELPAVGDFDYMSYALERATLFRECMKKLGV